MKSRLRNEVLAILVVLFLWEIQGGISSFISHPVVNSYPLSGAELRPMAYLLEVGTLAMILALLVHYWQERKGSRLYIP